MNTCTSSATNAATGFFVNLTPLDALVGQVAATKRGLPDVLADVIHQGGSKLVTSDAESYLKIVRYDGSIHHIRWHMHATWTGMTLMSIMGWSKLFNWHLLSQLTTNNCILKIEKLPWAHDKTRITTHTVACRLKDSEWGPQIYISEDGGRFEPSYTGENWN